ncbi:hypothetical protein [Variovorax gossypii]
MNLSSILERTLSAEDRDALAAANDRYMYFVGVYTDHPVVDHRSEDRAAFAHLLVFTDDGRPSLSDERCAEFMSAVSGLPREWCAAWKESDLVREHGEGFFDRLRRREESDRLALDRRRLAA